jgi:hypothetical protein
MRDLDGRAGAESAYRSLVDRLLTAPQFGEHFARLWLDIARYGEDQAHTFKARKYPLGYRYRDWVVEAINQVLQKAAQGPMQGIIEYCTDPVVSSDIIGNPHSSIFDSRLTMTIGTHSAKVLSWYDNEWGYSSRVVDLIDRLRD